MEFHNSFIILISLVDTLKDTVNWLVLCPLKIRVGKKFN